MLIAFDGVLQDNIPVLRCGGKQINNLIIATLYKTLTSGVKTNQLIRIRQTSLRRAHPTNNMALCLIKDIGIFING
jgi:hypothetical protein